MGSYNECNERALGSKWLNLKDFSSWEQVKAELVKEGFKLDGIDEELFVQDIDGLNDNGVNCDFLNPQTLIEWIYNNDILENLDLTNKVIEAVGLSDAMGTNIEDCYFYEFDGWGSKWTQLAIKLVDEGGLLDNVPEFVRMYFDYKTFGRDLEIDSNYYDVSDGILEINH